MVTAMRLLLLCLGLLLGSPAAPPRDDVRNVIWITIDDCGPDFGSYGNEVVATPNLDRLAQEGQRFTNAFASTPVCSPCRSAMITGAYATSIGSHQHRSKNALPEGVRPITEVLAEHGVRSTFLPHERLKPKAYANGAEAQPGHFPIVAGASKEDFNFSRGGPSLFAKWDPESKDQPFFALIDFNGPKIGQGTGRAHTWAQATDSVVDPASLELPPYWVDVPKVRNTYARYFEGIALLDAEVGQLLAWLEREGLRESTMVMVVGDHGLAMLRHKQWCYDTGIAVPLIVSGAGVTPGVRDELVSTIDLAATTLKAFGVAAPQWIEGRDLLSTEKEGRRYVFASRDRCDETEDRVRAVRSQRWKLIHNLRPELSWIGRNRYTRRTFPNVELLLALENPTPEQALFLRPTKPEYELFDLASDPLELSNLAGDEEHRATLNELQLVLAEWTADTDARNVFPEALETITPERVQPQVAELRRQQAASARPNVLFILADDLGYGELGSYGQERIETPHLDQLAERGMRFTQHYSGHTVCAPSRCVFLTGKHTGHAQIRGNSPWARKSNPQGEGQEPLDRDTLTLARWLAEQGYATACIGKWGLGGPETDGHPNLQGFDRFFGYLCQWRAHDYYPENLWRDDKRVPLDNPGFTPAGKFKEAPDDPAAYDKFSGNDYAPDLMIEEALGWLGEERDEPFFLYYATPVPHVSLQVPADSLAPYVEKGWDEAPYLGNKGYTPHPAPRAAYAAMITRMDRDIGRLVERLEELGLRDDTLIVFTSDNGPTFNGGVDSKFFKSSGGLRGGKTTLYEGGIRVPMIASWPGRIAPRTVSDLPSGFQDFFPTVCEALGEEAPEGLDGRSLLAELTGEDAERTARSFYWEAGRKQALRSGDWKVIRLIDKQDRVKAQLFDLAADPSEKKDLAKAQPEVLKRLLAELDAARVPNDRFATPFD